MNVTPDEFQVFEDVLGWLTFRSCEFFKYLNAALAPRYLLSSGSMTEAALCRVAGEVFNLNFLSTPSPTDTVGILRRDILPFYKTPARMNIYQSLRYVDIITPRSI